MKFQLASALLFRLLSSGSLSAATFSQTHLASDIPGLAAQTDSHLKDLWGVSFSTATLIWIFDRATGVTSVYTGASSTIDLVVTVPPGTPTTGPTGRVFADPTTTFTVNGSSANFIFDTLGGALDAWNSRVGKAASVLLPPRRALDMKGSQWQTTHCLPRIFSAEVA